MWAGNFAWIDTGAATNGALTRISMDGSGTAQDFMLPGRSHDFAILPNGDPMYVTADSGLNGPDTIKDLAEGHFDFDALSEHRRPRRLSGGHRARHFRRDAGHLPEHDLELAARPRGPERPYLDLQQPGHRRQRRRSRISFRVLVSLWNQTPEQIEAALKLDNLPMSTIRRSPSTGGR
jgi:hypothetical protein